MSCESSLNCWVVEVNNSSYQTQRQGGNVSLEGESSYEFAQQGRMLSKQS